MKKKIVFVCLFCMCVLFVNAQQLEKGVKEAVNGLADRLNTQLDVSIGSMTLDGKPNTVSAFSRFLSILVYDSADEVPLFRVVNVNRSIKQREDPAKGVINGVFAQRGNTVEVFLYLVTDPDGVSRGTQRFTFPFAELTQRGISLEPENIAVVEKQEQILMNLNVGVENRPPVGTTTVNQVINIRAFFNSESMTYLHGDELQMTVTADKNCYFKIIHIDVNNQIRMIYPKRGDNNFLRANASRNVFDTPNSRQILCEPYGAETLVVVASTTQFPNIEREYNEPWRTATEEAMRAAFAGAEQARYSITIIKPHEEYEYTKPQNMTETYRAIRDDTVRQGGYFEGNATSGFYIIDNIRGSYRVPSNNPKNIIQFTTYYLDAYTADSYSGTRTRGSGFNFSFAKPQNIREAVQTVSSSILEKGGTFTGNEQEGNFRASGITGQYKVADVVNVTISEKPFVVPNSLIENEVKKFFGVR